MTAHNNTVAVIGGQGAMAPLVLRELRRLGKKSLLLAIRGLTHPDTVALSDAVEWQHINQLGRTLRLCRRHQVDELVFAGRVQHKSVFQLRWWKSDWTTLRILMGLKDLRADSLLGAIASYFERNGIEVAPTSRYLGKQLAPPGQLTPQKPTAGCLKDIKWGLPIARELGRLDIGQTVVIKNRSVVAVEAMEGTDSCIERAAALAGPGCTVIKLAKPSQDPRFDLPVIGKTTIAKLIEAGAAALAIEAGRTLLIDPDCLEMASRHDLVIVSLPPFGSEGD